MKAQALRFLCSSVAGAMVLIAAHVLLGIDLNWTETVVAISALLVIIFVDGFVERFLQNH